MCTSSYILMKLEKLKKPKYEKLIITVNTCKILKQVINYAIFRLFNNKMFILKMTYIT